MKRRKFLILALKRYYNGFEIKSVKNVNLPTWFRVGAFVISYRRNGAGEKTVSVWYKLYRNVWKLKKMLELLIWKNFAWAWQLTFWLREYENLPNFPIECVWIFPFIPPIFQMLPRNFPRFPKYWFVWKKIVWLHEFPKKITWIGEICFLWEGGGVG